MLGLAVMVVALSCAGGARAGEKGLGPSELDGEREAPDHAIVVGVGGAVEVETAGGAVSPGANLFVEWDAIEHWLELEVGASVLSAERGVEVPIDFLAKKPFQLARGIELMIGLGPEIVVVSTPAKKATFFGIEGVLDFMFWPTRHLGVWVEPSYDLVFRDGLSNGVGSTGGVIVGW